MECLIEIVLIFILTVSGSLKKSFSTMRLYDTVLVLYYYEKTSDTSLYVNVPFSNCLLV